MAPTNGSSGQSCPDGVRTGPGNQVEWLRPVARWYSRNYFRSTSHAIRISVLSRWLRFQFEIEAHVAAGDVVLVDLYSDEVVSRDKQVGGDRECLEVALV